MINSSDRMMEYYYSMGQDCLTNGALDHAVTYFRKAANMGADEAAYEICAIGRQMETGDGVEKNEEKAESCYKIGCRVRHRESQPVLGRDVPSRHPWRKTKSEESPPRLRRCF